MLEKNGDLFTTDAFWIGHGCNVDGVMGAGIAKIVRDRYPMTYEAYKKQCMGGNFRTGDAFGVYERKKIIVNLATQSRPGPFASYDWVFQACTNAAIRIRDNKFWEREGHEKRIAIPEIGCGIGGLEWPKVKVLIQAVEVLIPEVEWEVWHYDG